MSPNTGVMLVLAIALNMVQPSYPQLLEWMTEGDLNIIFWAIVVLLSDEYFSIHVRSSELIDYGNRKGDVRHQHLPSSSWTSRQ